MYDEMNKELASLYQGIQNYKKSDAILRDLKGQLSDLSRKEANYAVELDLELEDVDCLNRKSFSSLIYTVLGTKEDKEIKERQEALAAQTKLDEVRREKEELNYRISLLQAEKNKFVSCEQDFNRLYKQKYDTLKTGNESAAQKINIFENNISKCERNIKELDEAISAGSLVLDRLIDVESSLNSAKGWGTWDMLGGGLISDLAKHSHIDDAKNTVEDVKMLLNNFHSELADINISSSIIIDIDGFTKFADFFFDGIFADWVVQSRINDSIDSVLKVKSNVDEILIRLKQMQSNEENTISSLKENIKNFIMDI
ncbi:MAG: hypothetical protein K0R54_4875 [Clostridiaceae bacterium]|jgi:hypothetical protein|nr:hypothetical protein [Clostridiaceae bacterium]